MRQGGWVKVGVGGRCKDGQTKSSTGMRTWTETRDMSRPSCAGDEI